MKFISDLLGWFLKLAVLVYRYSLAYFLGGRCRFEPSCSAYALDALSIHGPFKGGYLAARRLCRCHPFGGHGYDPVPAVQPEVVPPPHT